MVIGLMEPPCTLPFKGDAMAGFILNLFSLKKGFIPIFSSFKVSNVGHQP